MSSCPSFCLSAVGLRVAFCRVRGLRAARSSRLACASDASLVACYALVVSPCCGTRRLLPCGLEGVDRWLSVRLLHLLILCAVPCVSGPVRRGLPWVRHRLACALGATLVCVFSWLPCEVAGGLRVASALRPNAVGSAASWRGYARLLPALSFWSEATTAGWLGFVGERNISCATPQTRSLLSANVLTGNAPVRHHWISTSHRRNDTPCCMPLDLVILRLRFSVGSVPCPPCAKRRKRSACRDVGLCVQARRARGNDTRCCRPLLLASLRLQPTVCNSRWRGGESSGRCPGLARCCRKCKHHLSVIFYSGLSARPYVISCYNFLHSCLLVAVFSYCISPTRLYLVFCVLRWLSCSLLNHRLIGSITRGVPSHLWLYASGWPSFKHATYVV